MQTKISKFKQLTRGGTGVRKVAPCWRRREPWVQQGGRTTGGGGGSGGED